MASRSLLVLSCNMIMNETQLDGLGAAGKVHFIKAEISTQPAQVCFILLWDTLTLFSKMVSDHITH